MIPDRDHTQQDHVECPVHGPSPMFIVGPENRAVYCNRCAQELPWQDALVTWMDERLSRLEIIPPREGE